MAATEPTTKAERARDERERFSAALDEFFAAVKRARGQAVAEIEKEGLSLAQYQLLASFSGARRGDCMSVGTIAEAADVSQPTATRMLDALERAGVVSRSPSDSDRRSVSVELTPRGRRLLRRKEKLVEERRMRVYEAIPEADRDRAIALLRAMAAAIEGRS